MDTLELKPAKREGGGGKTGRTYHDFFINGRSIREMIDVGDTIGIFGEGARLKEWNKRIASQFLLKSKSELESGRVPLYICPECGDLLEGTITVAIVEDKESFIWSDFGYECYYGEKILEKYKIGPFRFNKIEYNNLLSQFI
jgi:hypothetical protein